MNLNVELTTIFDERFNSTYREHKKTWDERRSKEKYSEKQKYSIGPKISGFPNEPLLAQVQQKSQQILEAFSYENIVSEQLKETPESVLNSSNFFQPSYELKGQTRRIVENWEKGTTEKEANKKRGLKILYSENTQNAEQVITSYNINSNMKPKY